MIAQKQSKKNQIYDVQYKEEFLTFGPCIV